MQETIDWAVETDAVLSSPRGVGHQIPNLAWEGLAMKIYKPTHMCEATQMCKATQATQMCEATQMCKATQVTHYVRGHPYVARPPAGFTETWLQRLCTTVGLHMQ